MGNPVAHLTGPDHSDTRDIHEKSFVP